MSWIPSARASTLARKMDCVMPWDMPPIPMKYFATLFRIVCQKQKQVEERYKVACVIQWNRNGWVWDKGAIFLSSMTRDVFVCDHNIAKDWLTLTEKS
jgi:hypothetical protein